MVNESKVGNRYEVVIDGVIDEELDELNSKDLFSIKEIHITLGKSNFHALSFFRAEIIGYNQWFSFFFLSKEIYCYYSYIFLQIK